MEEYGEILQEALFRIQDKGITLIKSKCLFGVSFWAMFYQSLALEQTCANQATSKFPKLSNKKQRLQWLGVLNYIGRFILYRLYFW